MSGWCSSYGLVSFSSSLRLEAMLWHGALFTEDMSSIYACKHAETIENAVWQTSIFRLILSQPSFTVLYGPGCLGSTLRNIKKITWAEHCSKWQANALGISKKTLVRTYIHQRWSRLQTTIVFTIYSFSMFAFFFFFFFLFIVTCHMRSLDYKSTWTNCLYISMHSCFLIYILFTNSNEGEKDQQHCFPFMCVVYISWTGNRERSRIDLQSVQDMHVKYNICWTEQMWCLFTVATI